MVDTNGNPVTGTFTSLGHAYDRTGNLSKYEHRFWWNYDNKFYVGGSLNFKGERLNNTDFSRLSLDVDNNNSYVLNKQGTPYTEDSNGFSVSAGIIGKINNNIRLGRLLNHQLGGLNTELTAEVNEDNLGYYFDYYDEDRKFTSPMKATLSGAL